MELYFLVFLIIQAVFAVVLIYPWKADWPFAKYALQLPILLIVLTIAHEFLVPKQMNIRVDLLVIVFELAVAALFYCVRLTLFSREKTNGDAEKVSGVRSLFEMENNADT